MKIRDTQLKMVPDFELRGLSNTLLVLAVWCMKVEKPANELNFSVSCKFLSCRGFPTFTANFSF
jgi:hypothetical protein